MGTFFSFSSDCIVRKVFVSGKFNVLHPGHIRLLQFAKECGDWLIVGVESDVMAGQAAYVPEQLRLEGVKSCSLVDEAILLTGSVFDAISERKPEIVVKGREHEFRENVEASAVDLYGGKLLFSSGEVVFASRDLIKKEFAAERSRSWGMPHRFMERHGISTARLHELLSEFSRLTVLVIGDLIIDEYISCDPLGMSQEDPTLVVKPIDTKRFVGGAGIVAAHAAGLGGASTLLSVSGADSEAADALEVLRGYGVTTTHVEDPTRPTTLKTRFRCQGKTLLRVSRLHQTAISTDLADRLLVIAGSINPDVDLVVFSDFNYGTLTQRVVNGVSALFRDKGSILCADSQSSSQFGDVARFRGMDLLTPTEREARLSVRSSGDGLNVLGETLRTMADAKNVILKLGQEGALICPGNSVGELWPPDQIEALNPMPKDVAGAGDSMLIASGMALAVGANIWEAACLGSIAAAIQVGRVGNTPISLAEMRAALTS